MDVSENEVSVSITHVTLGLVQLVLVVKLCPPEANWNLRAIVPIAPLPGLLSTVTVVVTVVDQVPLADGVREQVVGVMSP